MAEANTKTNTGAPQNTAPSEPKFPSEIIDLPSGGKIYGKDSPLYEGKIEIKYMTAREEDILTSANLIKKGAVLEKLMDSLILTQGVKTTSLVLGDKNAIMVAIRILAYGPEYVTEITDPDSGQKVEHTFNLADCPFKELPKDVDYSANEFGFTLPVAKVPIRWRLITGLEEDRIDRELNAKKKIGHMIQTGITSRLKHIIVELDGERDIMELSRLIHLLPIKDSQEIRKYLQQVTPGLDLDKTAIAPSGREVKFTVTFGVSFFRPFFGI